ncbi:hypothetical protein Noc_0132 [Nitrosococcus oceani ATCC 19707]|uniref:Uncharacterized protein n=3 Tax=Nitrosococcus oceani TaxID=1229 RepID=Q3JET1_NITOC|nr:hypothetical protein [Nitrosococcus oceani]ABA56665.1 hypothetical protein Noc_0132 [Nitrosococcus oceani ATCC 19707]KFI20911.1 hypothetical protein IB75_00620 [Nitrosococcus oceani C-27]
MVNSNLVPLRVATFGVGQHVRKLLEMAFSGPGKGNYLLVEETSAEAGILDLDGPSWKMVWNDYRSRFPKRPALIMSMRPAVFQDSLVIPKPVRLETLLAALEKLRANCRCGGKAPRSSPQQPLKSRHGAGASKSFQIPSSSIKAANSTAYQPFIFGAAEAMERGTIQEYCGNAPDRDVTDPIQLEKIYYDPHRYFQGYLHNALIKAQAIGGARITSGWGEVIVLSEVNQAMLRLSDRQLRPLCVMPLAKANVDISALAPQEVEALYSQVVYSDSWQSLHPLLWKVALWTSRGRIPLGVPLDRPVCLKHWPNLTRLLLTPHAMRIAALWAVQPCSLMGTVATLQIPQRYVFAFFSALHSVGLVELEQITVKKVPSSIPASHHQGILGRVLNRLRKASPPL